MASLALALGLVPGTLAAGAGAAVAGAGRALVATPRWVGSCRCSGQLVIDGWNTLTAGLLLLVAGAMLGACNLRVRHWGRRSRRGAALVHAGTAAPLLFLAWVVAQVWGGSGPFAPLGACCLLAIVVDARRWHDEAGKTASAGRCVGAYSVSVAWLSVCCGLGVGLAPVVRGLQGPRFAQTAVAADLCRLLRTLAPALPALVLALPVPVLFLPRRHHATALVGAWTVGIGAAGSLVGWIALGRVLA